MSSVEVKPNVPSYCQSSAFHGKLCAYDYISFLQPKDSQRGVTAKLHPFLPKVPPTKATPCVSHFLKDLLAVYGPNHHSCPFNVHSKYLKDLGQWHHTLQPPLNYAQPLPKGCLVMYGATHHSRPCTMNIHCRSRKQLHWESRTSLFLGEKLKRKTARSTLLRGTEINHSTNLIPHITPFTIPPVV